MQRLTGISSCNVTCSFVHAAGKPQAGSIVTCRSGPPVCPSLTSDGDHKLGIAAGPSMTTPPLTSHLTSTLLHHNHRTQLLHRSHNLLGLVLGYRLLRELGRALDKLLGVY